MRVRRGPHEKLRETPKGKREREQKEKAVEDYKNANNQGQKIRAMARMLGIDE